MQTLMALYVAKFAEAVYVLHAMTKKTQNTPRQDIEIAAKRFQQQAAKTLGVTRPRLNALLKGKITDFSLDALVNMLAHAGMQVMMTVKKAA